MCVRLPQSLLPDGAHDAAWWLRVLLRVVEGLEDPGQGVNAEIEEGAAG